MNALSHGFAIASLFVFFTASGCSVDGPAQWLVEIQSADAAVRRVAAEKLAELAPTSSDVISALSKASGDADPEVRRWGCRGLGKHKATDQIVALEVRLKDPATPVRRAAAYSLSVVAPEGTKWRDELLNGMREGDGGIIVAVREFQPRPEWAIPVLVDLCRDRRPGIRRIAVESLAVVGAGNEAAKKAIEAAMRDSDDRVRDAAAKASH